MQTIQHGWLRKLSHLCPVGAELILFRCDENPTCGEKRSIVEEIFEGVQTGRLL